MNLPDIRIYISYEPEAGLQAGRIDGWVRSGPDEAVHAGRGQTGPADDTPPCRARRAAFKAGIQAADVVVCVISQTASIDPWIDWELRTARACAPPRPLVGVLLHEFNVPPPAMVDCGALFVPFRRDTVDRAIRWAVDMQATADDFTLEDF